MLPTVAVAVRVHLLWARTIEKGRAHNNNKTKRMCEVDNNLLLLFLLSIHCVLQ